MSDFDPIDLTLLSVGFAQGAGHKANAVSIERAGHLIEVARMLERLYREVADKWDAVWGYDVAEPLGFWMGHEFVTGRDELPTLDEAEARARQLIDDAMEGR